MVFVVIVVLNYTFLFLLANSVVGLSYCLVLFGLVVHSCVCAFALHVFNVPSYVDEHKIQTQTIVYDELKYATNSHKMIN